MIRPSERLTAARCLEMLSEELEGNLTTIFAHVRKMITTDPASSSRFIDNKHKAIYDFILSDSQPLGPVCALK